MPRETTQKSLLNKPLDSLHGFKSSYGRLPIHLGSTEKMLRHETVEMHLSGMQKYP